MPVSKRFEEETLRRLQATRPVTSRKMFGGVGLYMGGPVFGIMDDDRLYLKVDALNVGPYDEAGAEPWVYDPAVGPVDKYRELPARVLADPEALGEWLDASAAAAERIAASKPSRKRRA